MKKRCISLLLIFVMLFSIVGCGKKPADQPVSTDTPGTTETKGIYTPGTYLGSAQGFAGIIEVEVTVDEDKITEVKAEGSKETEGIGDDAIKELSAKVVETNNTDLDSISGATYSSEGMMLALNEALSLARGEEQAPKEIVDGRYLTDVIGHEGLVTVSTRFLEGKIESVEVLTHDETQGVGTYAIAQIPGKIVEAQSVNVDVVSGATITSNVIKQAVSQAITEANGDIADFNSEVPKEAIVESKVEENVQVAIMGAGTAGLFAAAQLLENGEQMYFYLKNKKSQVDQCQCHMVDLAMQWNS